MLDDGYRRSAGRQRFLIDCEVTEPANCFVIALDFGLCRAPDAFASIALPVALLVPACARALPAKLR